MAVRLTELVDVASAARIEDFTLRYIDEEGTPSADGSWAATVDSTWAYAGFDPQPTSAEIAVRFTREADGVVIVGLGGGGLRTPVWMSGPIQVSRSNDLLVLASDGTDLDAYVRLARSAVPTVSSVVTTWARRLVVEVPANGAQLEAALDAEAGYYSQIAAVTGSSGDLSEGTPIHILVNPDVFARLGKAGREVVVAHEATHVATAAPFSKAPAWLTEGFADYVALRRTPLPLSRTAGQIAAQVRAEGLPDSLPAAAEFNTRGPHLGAVYEASWLACDVLARIGGPTALSSFYAAVSAGSPIAAALRRSFGLTPDQLIKAWQRVLESLPGTQEGATNG